MIVYDQPIVVTESQYEYLRAQFAGILCSRKTKYFNVINLEMESQFEIKVWSMKYAPMIQSYLNASR